jgi:glycine cleavage system H lipoate-binding protein
MLTLWVPIAKRYTKEHELVKFDDATGVGIVSITDHAQSVLGDVVFVELLPVGTNVVQGGECLQLSYEVLTEHKCAIFRRNWGC